MMYGGDDWMWGGWGWGGWILMTLATVVFWALVITAIVLAIRYLTGGSHPNQASPRFARAAKDAIIMRDDLFLIEICYMLGCSHAAVCGRRQILRRKHFWA
jgi:putative membrane protein